MEAWIPALVLNAALVLTLYLGRNAIKAFIERRVAHSFNTRLANLEGDIRKSEEELRSRLRAKETEIEALRSGALAGMSSRQEMLTKRRIEAAERIWRSVNALVPAELVSAYMVRLKFDELAKEAPHDERVRQFLELIGAPVKSWIDPTTNNFLPPKESNVQNERLFVNPLVWALYSAYSMMVILPVLQISILKTGVEHADRFLQLDGSNDLVKEALPEYSEYIDEHGHSGYHFLLKPLKDKLFAEIIKMLDGEEIDSKSIEHANKILSAVERVNEESATLVEPTGAEIDSAPAP